MRKIYWYLSAFWKKQGKVIVGSVLIAVVVFSFFIPLIARFLEAKKRLYIGVVGEYTIQSLPTNIQTLISSGLTSIEEDGSVKPAVSARWNIEDDGKTYRFIIKKDIIWQDGTELTPDDVSYSFDNVETITTQNDIVFKLPDEYIPFPTIVSQPIFKTETEPYLFFFKKSKVYGLGEYKIISFDQTTQQLQRQSRLTELVLDSKKERRIYRFYLTEDEAVSAFKRGEIDILTDLTSPYDIGDWSNTIVIPTLHTERYLGIFFDLNNPLFEKNIRQALYYALEKPQDETRAIGPINPKSWAYLNGGKSYDYDRERAIERLFSSLPSQKLEFELATSPGFAQKAEEIKKQWEEFGTYATDRCKNDGDIEEEDKSKCENLRVTIHIKISNYTDTNNFQSLLIGQKSPADPDQYYLWHSDQSGNFFNYKNTRIDSLLEKGRQVSDLNERKAIYQEFQQFLLEDAPAIFLEHLTSYEVRRK